MTGFLPQFVVVGNVNQGKSSIVAALIEDAAVPIASYPGTTCKCAEYSFRLGDQELFTIVDTPGFQDARAALQWMKERSTSPGDRPAAVRAFVEAHSGDIDDGRFADEVLLLEHVTKGASVIYVVDASSRFQPTSEAEMEILRWTGQPAMALINRTRERDHSAEWRPILEQFFNLVREFDAHDAGFKERLELLSGFREIRDEWRATIDRAAEALRQEWHGRRRKSAQVIAELLINTLGHVERRNIAGDEPPPGLAEELEKAYQDNQRRYEREARAEIERIYHHTEVERESVEVALHESDLFSEVSWRLFGLDRGQLAKYGLTFGAVIGGGVDVAMGGLSFWTGALAGALVGGLGGYFASTQVAKTLDSENKLARLLFGGETGQFLFKGPVSNPRYAWMLVDRALNHYRTIRDRSHARQDKMAIEGDSSSEAEDHRLVAALPGNLRDALHKDLQQLAKEAQRRAISQQLRENLATHLDAVLAAVARSERVALAGERESGEERQGEGRQGEGRQGEEHEGRDAGEADQPQAPTD